MTFAVMPWIADHGFPHSPEKVLEEALEDLGVWALADVTKGDDALEVALRRDEEAAPGCEDGAGDPFLDPVRDAFLLNALSLPSVA